MGIRKDPNFIEGPVTVIISRRVKPGRFREFEEWISGISRVTAQFKGYYGVNIIPPSDPGNTEYVVIFRFDNYKNLKRWEDSPIRSEWLERSVDLTEGDAYIRKLGGLEYWFRLPDNPLITPPPRYKMIVVTFIALFPAIILVSSVLDPLLNPLPELLRLAIALICTLIIMTYGIMPLMTRLLAFWLYSKKEKKHE